MRDDQNFFDSGEILFLLSLSTRQSRARVPVRWRIEEDVRALPFCGRERRVLCTIGREKEGSHNTA